jgi:hypothetical protein
LWAKLVLDLVIPIVVVRSTKQNQQAGEESSNHGVDLGGHAQQDQQTAVEGRRQK